MAEAADRERGERIRELRGHKPQPVMADAVGVSLRAYQEWEAGGGIRWENIKALAKFHHVEPDYILSGPKDHTPDLIGSFNGDGGLVQIAAQLNRVEAKLDQLLDALPEPIEDFQAAFAEADEQPTATRPKRRASTAKSQATR